MQRVLITAIGTMNCTTIISELKKYKNEYYLLGADINQKNFIANSKDVDEFYVFPKVTENREYYLSFIINFCVEKDIDIIYCVVDEEVALLSSHRSEFEKIGVTICIADNTSVQLCHDKNQFSEWIERKIPEICIKRFKNSTEILDSDYPIFIKPIEGRASIGCKKISNSFELEQYFPNWENYVVQEYIESPVVAVDIVSNQLYGQIEISQRLELLRNSNGCGIAVEIIDNPDIRKACESIVNKMKLNGVVNAEFFLTKDGPKIIEINPRIPAGVEYSCLSGLNVVLNALNIAKGEPCIFGQAGIGRYYAKRYETIEMY